ncbi:MAG TPA: hypothetical protein VER32_16465 [Pyrinomonadaceae bacterium]|nr:hypothetical protein [Pyrinomonadaceae bacterium]
MNKKISPTATRGLWRALVGFAALACLVLGPARAQTPGGTTISNTASASYSDGTNTYSTVSNPVTVTVANVSGLAITPDDANGTGGSHGAVTSGETTDFSFTVTNGSNFSTRALFLTGGASVRVFGPAAIAGARIDVDGDGFDTSEDTDIWTNAGPVTSALMTRTAPGNTITVVVRVTVNGTATPGQVVNVKLGDATGDNQAVAAPNANEVRTSSGGSNPVNGESEAVGDASAVVENDAQLLVSMTVPAGPVALGSNITYSLGIQSTGNRPVRQQTLQGAPAAGGVNSGIFVVVPVPAGTNLSSVPAPPAGVTVLYSTSPLGNDPGPGDPPASGPLSAAVTWTTTPPAVIGGTTRVAFRINNGNTLGVGFNLTGLDLVLTVRTDINASNHIYGIGEAFGRNNNSAPLTDQSGDAIANKGDQNANFNEPRRGVAPNPDEALSLTQGYQQPTTLVAVGNVLIGPAGFPGAVGPTGNNDDYTNKTVAPAVVAGLGYNDPSGAQAIVDFTNTVSNTGNANDTFTLTAPVVPPTFTVAISTDGVNFTDVTSGGSVSLAIAYGGQANITVRVTAPAGTPVLNGYATTIRATSANTATSSNNTIDRLYTGFLRLQKTVTVVNNTIYGNGSDDAGPDDAVPGAELWYAITYTNISNSGDPANPTAGTNCVQLVVTSLTITEDGTPGPGNTNNWATYTSHIINQATDTRGGTITGDNLVTSTVLTDAVNSSLLPGQSGTFSFRRLIN